MNFPVAPFPTSVKTLKTVYVSIKYSFFLIRWFSPIAPQVYFQSQVATDILLKIIYKSLKIRRGKPSIYIITWSALEENKRGTYRAYKGRQKKSFFLVVEGILGGGFKPPEPLSKNPYKENS